MSENAEPQVTFEAALGALLFTIVKELTAEGVPVGTAFRIASALAIESTLGPDALRDLGLPESTWYRWRAVLRDLADRGVTFEAARQSTIDSTVDHVAEACDLP